MRSNVLKEMLEKVADYLPERRGNGRPIGIIAVLLLDVFLAACGARPTIDTPLGLLNNTQDLDEALNLYKELFDAFNLPFPNAVDTQFFSQNPIKIPPEPTTSVPTAVSTAAPTETATATPNSTIFSAVEGIGGQGTGSDKLDAQVQSILSGENKALDVLGAVAHHGGNVYTFIGQVTAPDADAAHATLSVNTIKVDQNGGVLAFVQDALRVAYDSTGVTSFTQGESNQQVITEAYTQNVIQSLEALLGRSLTQGERDNFVFATEFTQHLLVAGVRVTDGTTDANKTIMLAKGVADGTNTSQQSGGLMWRDLSVALVDGTWVSTQKGGPVVIPTAAPTPEVISANTIEIRSSEFLSITLSMHADGFTAAEIQQISDGFHRQEVQDVFMRAWLAVLTANSDHTIKIQDIAGDHLTDPATAVALQHVAQTLQAGGSVSFHILAHDNSTPQPEHFAGMSAVKDGGEVKVTKETQLNFHLGVYSPEKYPAIPADEVITGSFNGGAVRFSIFIHVTNGVMESIDYWHNTRFGYGDARNDVTSLFDGIMTILLKGGDGQVTPTQINTVNGKSLEAPIMPGWFVISGKTDSLLFLPSK